jgi:hypothetical protein
MILNNTVRWRIYDIEYESDRKDLPTEIEVETDKFEWFNDIPIGFGNLNCKLSRMIKEITGCNSRSCKFDPLRK